MSDLDPRLAAALALHKPRTVDVASLGSSNLDHKPFYECVECDGYPWPCSTAVALGVRDEFGAAMSLIEALTWWWEAHGLDEEAAAVAAALEAGA